MKLLYIANIRLPTEKAHGIQIMSMMRVFAQSMNTESILIIPRRFNPIKKDPFSYYGFDKAFNIIRLPVVDFMSVPFFRRMWFWLESATFSIAVAVYAIFKKEAVFYTRDFLIVFLLSFLGEPVFYEVHTLPRRASSFHRALWRRSIGLIVISNGIRKELLSLGVSEDKILYAPDAVDARRFDIADSKEQARRILNLPLDKKIVLYAGHFYAWKGADILIDAAKQLDGNTVVYFVGGTEEDVSKHKTQNIKYKNIVFVGHRPHQEIPLWLRAADLLVLPTSAKEKIGREYTSPMKLFEYMASGTPIIAADTPAIREVLDETTSLFFEADNSHDLAEKIHQGVSRLTALSAVAEKAKNAAKGYSWEGRAEKVLGFIEKALHAKKIVSSARRKAIRMPALAIAFTKTDFWRTCIIGEAIALLSIPVFQNIKVFEILTRHDQGFLPLIILAWLVLLPFIIVAGLYGVYRLSLRWRPSIFQIGKYGLVGLLNTFVSAGILNLFIWVTNIARGWQVVFFTIVATTITITHSFFWNKFWTFQAHGTNNGKAEYLKFFMITGTTSLLNIFLLHVMVNVIGAPAGVDPKIWVNIVLAIEIPVAFLGNFFGYKMFVFKRHEGFVAGISRSQ